MAFNNKCSFYGQNVLITLPLVTYLPLNSYLVSMSLYIYAIRIVLFYQLYVEFCQNSNEIFYNEFCNCSSFCNNSPFANLSKLEKTPSKHDCLLE